MEDIELKLVATALRTGGNSSEIREKCGAFPCCLTDLGMHEKQRPHALPMSHLAQHTGRGYPKEGHVPAPSRIA